MEQNRYDVLANRPIAPGVYEMVLLGDTSPLSAPGQFVDIALPGRFLRRPISVCDWNEDTLTLVYKVVGGGTSDLAALKPGTALDLLCGLGNGFDMDKSGEVPLLIGGGVGIPPLYGLCRRLCEAGRAPKVILGFNTVEEVFFPGAFAALGVETVLCTADGSLGLRGFVTVAMPEAEPYTYFYACGPEGMLRAVCAASKTSGQLSLETRMGCGFGACMGCTCQTRGGPKRLCKDGPVLEKEELLW